MATTSLLVISVFVTCRSYGELTTADNILTTAPSTVEAEKDELLYPPDGEQFTNLSPTFAVVPTTTRSGDLSGATAEKARETNFRASDENRSPGDPPQMPHINDSSAGVTNVVPDPTIEPNVVETLLNTSTVIPYVFVGAPVFEEILITSTLAPIQLKIKNDESANSDEFDKGRRNYQRPQPAPPGPPIFQLVQMPHERQQSLQIGTAGGLPIYIPSDQDERTFENNTVKPSANYTDTKRLMLCGYPPYNDRVACRKQNYFSDPLFECENEGEKITFGIIVGIGGTAVICVNGLILVIIALNCDMRTNYDLIKVSLGLADGLLGVLVLATVFPNMLWIGELTEEELVQFALNDVNSPTAIIVGSLLMVTMQVSLLHLCFLSIERFMAIKWSFWRMRRKRRSIIITLVAIWIVSIVLAFVPAFFPIAFEYKFQPALLFHMLTMKPKPGTNDEVGYEGLVFTIITLALPYIVMVAVCVLTAVESYRKLRSASRVLGNEHGSTSYSHSVSTTKSEKGHSSMIRQSKKSNFQPEIAVFVTIVIMICAFTLTLLPFAVVVSLFTNKALTCDNYTIPYAIAFYFGLSNSLANGIIYSVRDPRFRSAVKRLFCKGTLNNSKKVSSIVTQSSRA